jgi:hypothetical protein
MYNSELQLLMAIQGGYLEGKIERSILNAQRANYHFFASACVYCEISCNIAAKFSGEIFSPL